ncbi:STM4015 family protein [Yinghuangia seranimata]|uniref:STM4015 family protein n=1 Tax=Yinghuangia seranimata TaxID=408067 RepID=UPI00248D1099|nr:STM4015 family protein [Yinghuangia seranimata]MDI2131552.1 STM4015 family protein [Yinghuangia seranimata]
MSVNEHETHFAGLPVVEATMDDERSIRIPQVADPGAVAWRLRLVEAIEFAEPESGFEELFQHFLDTVDTTRVRALLIGDWGVTDAEEDLPFTMLLGARDRFPALRALFLGDIVREESDVAYIPQGDLAPLLAAFPALEELATCGGEGLAFPVGDYPHLRRLRLQSGGMPAEVVRAVGASTFPVLEYLDVWLGVDRYGGDTTTDDLAGILNGAGLPSLTHLGLMDSEIQDAVAGAVAGAPIVARLTELDLSMGTLGDEGVEQLIAGQPLTHLRRLVLSHHFVGEGVQKRLRDAVPDVDVDLSDAQTEPDWGRYVAVSE